MYKLILCFKSNLLWLLIGMLILTLVYAHKTTAPNKHTLEGITQYTYKCS